MEATGGSIPLPSTEYKDQNILIYITYCVFRSDSLEV
jgi:hypothetical protein